MFSFVYGTEVEPDVQWSAGNAAIGIITTIFLFNLAYLLQSNVRKVIKLG